MYACMYIYNNYVPSTIYISDNTNYAYRDETISGMALGQRFSLCTLTAHTKISNLFVFSTHKVVKEALQIQ